MITTSEKLVCAAFALLIGFLNQWGLVSISILTTVCFVLTIISLLIFCADKVCQFGLSKSVDVYDIQMLQEIWADKTYQDGNLDFKTLLILSTLSLLVTPYISVIFAILFTTGLTLVCGKFAFYMIYVYYSTDPPEQE